MSNTLQKLFKTKWKIVLFATLIGAALATVIIKALSSDQTLGLSFNDWQVALVYGLSVAGSVLLALKDSLASHDTAVVATNDSGAAQTK